jgi:hypothetical protein
VIGPSVARSTGLPEISWSDNLDRSSALIDQNSTAVTTTGRASRRGGKFNSPFNTRRMLIARRSLTKPRDLLRANHEDLKISHGDHMDVEPVIVRGICPKVITRLDVDDHVVTGVQDCRPGYQQVQVVVRRLATKCLTSRTMHRVDAEGGKLAEDAWRAGGKHRNALEKFAVVLAFFHGLHGLTCLHGFPLLDFARAFTRLSLRVMRGSMSDQSCAPGSERLQLGSNNRSRHLVTA